LNTVDVSKQLCLAMMCIYNDIINSLFIFASDLVIILSVSNSNDMLNIKFFYFYFGFVISSKTEILLNQYKNTLIKLNYVL